MATVDVRDFEQPLISETLRRIAPLVPLDRIRVLFLASNPHAPTAPLRLDEEVRRIDRALRRGKARDALELVSHFAARTGTGSADADGHNAHGHDHDGRHHDGRHHGGHVSPGR